MRVISGTKGGTKLITPLNKDIRPTTDRIKETIFNIINFDIVDTSVVLDCFSGSGSIGIEFLSRGVSYCHFVESDKKNITIKQNIEKVKFENQQIHFMDVFEFLDSTNIKFDFIFLDPPYNKNFEEKSLDLIIKNNILNKDGIVICESSALTDLDKFSKYIYKEKKLKTTKITFLKNEDEDND